MFRYSAEQMESRFQHFSRPCVHSMSTPDPNPDSPANPEASNMFTDDKEKYAKRVRACVEESWVYNESFESTREFSFLCQLSIFTYRSIYPHKPIANQYHLKHNKLNRLETKHIGRLCVRTKQTHTPTTSQQQPATTCLGRHTKCSFFRNLCSEAFQQERETEEIFNKANPHNNNNNNQPQAFFQQGSFFRICVPE